MTAGQLLQATYDAALTRASREHGRQLEWTEAEATALRLAVESADAAERVKALLEAELAVPQPNPTIIVKLSAEWRLLNRAQMDYEWRLNPGLGQQKNPAKVRAGKARWAHLEARA